MTALWRSLPWYLIFTLHFDYLHSALVEPILITNSLLALFSLFIHTFLSLTHTEVKKGNTDYKLVSAENGKRKKKEKKS